MIQVRDYRPDDRSALREVFQSAVLRVASRDYTPDQIAAWAGARRDGDPFANHQVWVAEAGGGPVGFIDLEQDGHVDHLFVDADHQGAGVAAALYGVLEAEARRRGLTRLYVEASHTARGFFERQGFAVEARQTVTIGAVTLDNWRMDKPL